MLSESHISEPIGHQVCFYLFIIFILRECLMVHTNLGIYCQELIPANNGVYGTNNQVGVLVMIFRQVMVCNIKSPGIPITPAVVSGGDRTEWSKYDKPHTCS